MESDYSGGGAAAPSHHAAPPGRRDWPLIPTRRSASIRGHPGNASDSAGDDSTWRRHRLTTEGGLLVTEHISLTVNGQSREADVEPRRLLVDLIRENFELTGTHVGCDTSQ